MIEDYDELAMYFRADFHVNKYIVIRQPTIGEIAGFGERRYYSVISQLTAIPSDMKSELDDMGIDYTTVKDYELFLMLATSLNREDTQLLFGDLNLSSMEHKTNANNEPILFDPISGAIIDEYAYLRLSGYLRKLHGISSKVEKAANETTRKILIQLDRDKKKRRSNQPYQSVLKPMISTLMRFSGCKYTAEELWNCGLYELTDAYRGSFVYIQAIAALNGYFNNVDFEKSKGSINLDWSKALS